MSTTRTERTYGRPSYWELEEVATEVFGDPSSIWLGASATISREVPMSEGNRPLHRTAINQNSPVTADIKLSDGLSTSHMIRDFAAWLLKLADKMDELDKPHPDEAPRGAGGERSSGT